MTETRHAYTDADPVVAQYERWPYPQPFGDDLSKLSDYLKSYEIIRQFAFRFWPTGKPRDDLHILVAGCGTMAAASYAYGYPECRVTGIDISRTSLAHEEKLKERHNLQNLTLCHCPIEDVASLGATFDYVSCHGVLHHIADPATALRAMGSVLTPEGIICVGLYGNYPRLHVYVFQELFRLLGLEQNPEGVAVVRETLASLSPDHPLQSYLRLAVDHNNDAGLVDTYLHRRDCAYTVSDCLALVAKAGLVFQGWNMNFGYHPDGPFCTNTVLRQRLDALPDEQVWQAMEMISGSLRAHEFHVCRSDRDPATYRVPWESEKLLACVPGKCVELLQIRGSDGTLTWGMGGASLAPVPLTPPQAAIVSQIDGRRNVRECLAAAGVRGSTEILLETARPVLRLLWRTGYGLLHIPRGQF